MVALSALAGIGLYFGGVLAVSTGPLSAPSAPNESPADTLARLQVIMGQLPWGPFGPGVSLNPPDIMDPIVILPRQVDLQMRWNSLNGQLATVEHALLVCKTYAMLVPPSIPVALVAIEMEVLALQQESSA